MTIIMRMIGTIIDCVETNPAMAEADAFGPAVLDEDEIAGDDRALEALGVDLREAVLQIAVRDVVVHRRDDPLEDLGAADADEREGPQEGVGFDRLGGEGGDGFAEARGDDEEDVLLPGAHGGDGLFGGRGGDRLRDVLGHLEGAEEGLGKLRAVLIKDGDRLLAADLPDLGFRHVPDEVKEGHGEDEGDDELFRDQLLDFLLQEVNELFHRRELLNTVSRLSALYFSLRAAGVPESRMTPLSIRATRSERYSISSMLWEDRRTEMPSRA